MRMHVVPETSIKLVSNIDIEREYQCSQSRHTTVEHDSSLTFSGTLISGHSFGFFGAFLDCARSIGPYFRKTNGTGVNANDTTPRMVEAHLGVSFSYI